MQQKASGTVMAERMAGYATSRRQHAQILSAAGSGTHPLTAVNPDYSRSNLPTSIRAGQSAMTFGQEHLA